MSRTTITNSQAWTPITVAILETSCSRAYSRVMTMALTMVALLIFVLPVPRLAAADTDDDGISDSTDNCPLVANPDQHDAVSAFIVANTHTRYEYTLFTGAHAGWKIWIPSDTAKAKLYAGNTLLQGGGTISPQENVTIYDQLNGADYKWVDHGGKKQEEWVQIRLLFSCPVNQYKDNWAVFLSTDVQLDAEKILQLYSLRWSIEVYFKEIKQHLGFLKEQSGDYAVHYASIHLCAIRYLLIVDSMLRSGEAFGKMRNHISGKLEMLTFARLLWELFKALIGGALDSLLQTIPQKTILLIKYKINETVCNFLNKALQLDEDYLFAEQKAEAFRILN